MTFAALFSRIIRPPFGPGLAAAGTSGPVTLIYDTFTAVDGTNISGRSPSPTNTPGTSWTESVGDWSISGGKAVLAASSARQHCTCDAGVADCTITVDVDNRTTNLPLSNDGGVIVRWSDINNYWKIGINAAADLFRISERNAGTETDRASTSVAIDPGTVYTIVVVLSGQTITATLNGGSSISYSFAALNQTVTVHGFANRTTTDTIDNWKLTVP